MRHSHWVPALLSATMLISCTTPATENAAGTAVSNTETPRGLARFADDPRLGEEIESACFARNIRGFSDNTEETVVLRRSTNVRYLIEMVGLCIDLEQAQTIALINRQRCVRPGDRIFVSRFLTGLDDGDFTTGQCTIGAIYAWDHTAKADAENSEP
jgi:hypothetical protein